MSLGMLVFTAVIARLGTAAVAANEIALNILSLGFMPANGFGLPPPFLWINTWAGDARLRHVGTVCIPLF